MQSVNQTQYDFRDQLVRKLKNSSQEWYIHKRYETQLFENFWIIDVKVNMNHLNKIIPKTSIIKDEDFISIEAASAALPQEPFDLRFSAYYAFFGLMQLIETHHVALGYNTDKPKNNYAEIEFAPLKYIIESKISKVTIINYGNDFYITEAENKYSYLDVLTPKYKLFYDGRKYGN